MTDRAHLTLHAAHAESGATVEMEFHFPTDPRDAGLTWPIEDALMKAGWTETKWHLTKIAAPG